LTTYPDVSVVCGKAEIDSEDPHAIVNPTVVVEVLSDSTEAYDRGEKAAHYRHLPSLREYVLVSQHRPRIEVYRKNDAGRWGSTSTRAGAASSLRPWAAASRSTRCTATRWPRSAAWRSSPLRCRPGTSHRRNATDPGARRR
jgi:hypothetical protein